MASGAGGSAGGRRQGRRWRFGSAVFDEASWTLTVDGQRVAIEAKPLELLHELLLRAGEVVTKDELLDAVWPGVSVVEASLPTAIAKLRRALGDSQAIETVPRIGYRLVVALHGEGEDDAEPLDTPPPPAGTRRWLAAAGVALVVAASGFAAAEIGGNPRPVTRDEVVATMRALDTPHLRDMLARGWDINQPVNREGDTALNIALEVCEWNPGHDRKKMLMFVRTMLDKGARYWTRNAFGDTAYSIAKAPRYCGVGHPVTEMLRIACYDGAAAQTVGAKCEAAYAKRPFTHADAETAIRKLDVEKIEALIRAGWSPNTPFDDQGNGAMTFVLNICEWNPGHDRKRMLLMVRTLMEAGARIDVRNKWGDTAYSIAKAKRYCGPDHPVTRMFRTLCYAGPNPPGDKCLASYEIKKP